MEKIYSNVEGQSQLSFDTKTTSESKIKKIFNYNFVLHIVSAIVAVLFLFPFELYAQITTLTTPGTLTSPWTVPSSVTKIKVEAWGAGGGGGGASVNNTGGSGGGGGGYASYSKSVTPLAQITFSVGTAGTGGTDISVAGAGGNTSILELTAEGGKGGAKNAGAAGTGGKAYGGTTITPGADGTIGTYASQGAIGGAGGKGANGGNGGATRTTVGIGNPGTFEGGAGGGALTSGNSKYSGGAGANGKISISYSNYALTSTSTTNACIGSFAVVTLNSTVGSLPAGTYTLSYTYSGANSGTINNQGITITGTSNTTGSFNTANFSTAGSTTITITKIETTDYGNLISTNNTATINVNANLSAVSITPSTDQTICEDGTGTALTAAETGGGAMTRAWGKRSVSGGTITAISGATGQTYTPSGSGLGVGTWYIVCTSTPACGSSIISNEVIVTVNATGTWLGTTSQSWNDASNWCGGIPSSTTDVRIPANVTNFPTITLASECRNIEIESGASLVESTGYLTVSGKATVKRNISNDWKWHFLSSPVVAQNIWPNFATTPISGSFGTPPLSFNFYYYNPNALTATQLYWVSLFDAIGLYNSADIDLVGNFAGFGPEIPIVSPGRGYLVTYSSGWAVQHTFTGALNTGPISPELKLGVNPQSYNLVGNPYPSSIDWSNAATGWSRGDLVQNGGGYDYWIWNDDPSVGNYAAFNSADPEGSGADGADRYIAPQQAFFVQASGDGSLGMTNAIRAHSGQAWLKSTNSNTADFLKLKLTTTATTYSDEMVVSIDPSFSGGGTDKFWSFYSEAPALYSFKDGRNLCIDRYSSIDEDLEINVNAKIGVSGTYTITASNISDFTLSSKVLLLDKKTNITTDLKQTSSYNFVGDISDAQNRFLLLIGSPLGINDPIKSSFNIYNLENVIYVQNDKINEPYFVTVSNMLGQTLVRTDFTGNSLNRIEMQNVPGVYVVNVVSNGKTYSQKVVIR